MIEWAHTVVCYVLMAVQAFAMVLAIGVVFFSERKENLEYNTMRGVWIMAMCSLAATIKYLLS